MADPEELNAFRANWETELAIKLSTSNTSSPEGKKEKSSVNSINSNNALSTSRSLEGLSSKVSQLELAQRSKSKSSQKTQPSGHSSVSEGPSHSKGTEGILEKNKSDAEAAVDAYISATQYER